MTTQTWTIDSLNTSVILKPTGAWPVTYVLVEILSFPNGTFGQFGGSQWPIYAEELKRLGGVDYSVFSKKKLDAVNNLLLLNNAVGVKLSCSNPLVKIKVTMSDDASFTAVAPPQTTIFNAGSHSNLVNMETFTNSSLLCYRVLGVANTIGEVSWNLPANFAKGIYTITLQGYAQGASGVPLYVYRSGGVLASFSLPSSGTAAWSRIINNVALNANDIVKATMTATGNNKGCLRSVTLTPV